jgi:hypothetical protein
MGQRRMAERSRRVGGLPVSVCRWSSAGKELRATESWGRFGAGEQVGFDVEWLRTPKGGEVVMQQRRVLGPGED